MLLNLKVANVLKNILKILFRLYFWAFFKKNSVLWIDWIQTYFVLSSHILNICDFGLQQKGKKTFILTTHSYQVTHAVILVFLGILESLIQLQSVYGITRRSIKNKVLDFLVVFVFFPMPSTASKTLVVSR